MDALSFKQGFTLTRAFLHLATSLVHLVMRKKGKKAFMFLIGTVNLLGFCRFDILMVNWLFIVTTAR